MSSPARATMTLVRAAVVARLVRAARAAILARLLAPDVFGAAALIGAVVGPILSLTNIGLGNAVAREAKPSERLVATANWASRIIAAVTVGLLGCLVVAWAYGSGRTSLLGPAMTAAVGVGVYLMPQAELGLLQQEKRFGALARLDIAFDLVWTVTAVLLAVALRNVWALVLAELVAQVARLGMVRYAIRRPIGARMHTDELKKLLRFAGGTIISSLLYGLVFASPILLLQMHCRDDQIGLYALAATYSQVAAFVLAGAASRVLLPQLANSSPEARMALVGRYSERIAAVLGILTGLIASAGQPLLVALVGDNWQGATLPLALLTWAVGIRVCFPFNLLAVAAGRPVLESILAAFSLTLLWVVELGWGWTSIGRGAAFVLATDLLSTGLAMLLAAKLWGRLSRQYLTVAAIWAVATLAAAVAQRTPGVGILWVDGVARASVFLAVFAAVALGSRRLRRLYKDEIANAISFSRRPAA